MSASHGGGQPQSVEVERAVIGALMRGNRTPPGVPIRLRPEHFSVVRHQAIWRAALALIDAGQQANPVSLRRALADGDNVVDLRPDLASMAAEALPPEAADRCALRVVLAFVERHVARLQEDVDRLTRALPDNFTAEMMGAYMLVRCADIATQACGLSLGGRHLAGSDREVVLSLVSDLVDMVEAADGEALS